MTDIPIYRAKKNNSNEYIKGFLIGVVEEEQLCSIRDIDSDDVGGEICDLTTLSIHFPDMLDANKNKIFASLNQYGIGGDVCISEQFEGEINMVFESIETIPYFSSWSSYIVNKIKN